jgi:hypothetical protein
MEQLDDFDDFSTSEFAASPAPALGSAAPAPRSVSKQVNLSGAMSDDAIEQAIVDSIKSINDEQEKRSSKRTVPPLLDMPKVSMNVGGSAKAAKRALGKFKERSKSFGKRSGGKKGGGGEEVVEASGDGLSVDDEGVGIATL